MKSKSSLLYRDGSVACWSQPTVLSCGVLVFLFICFVFWNSTGHLALVPHRVVLLCFTLSCKTCEQHYYNLLPTVDLTVIWMIPVMVELLHGQNCVTSPEVCKIDWNTLRVIWLCCFILNKSFYSKARAPEVIYLPSHIVSFSYLLQLRESDIYIFIYFFFYIHSIWSA